MSVQTATTIALKEWGAAIHALLEGRQTVLLRKGGIHERVFDTSRAREPFVLFPTVAHSHAERTRPEHRDLLERGAADARDDAVTIRCGVRIVDVVAVSRPERLPAVRDLHIWTDASIQADRVEFRPKHDLQVLVVQAVQLPTPVELPRTEAFGGCRSWIDVPLVWDGAGREVHAAARLQADAERVRAAVAG